jgi:cytochrome c biogenesis protein
MASPKAAAHSHSFVSLLWQAAASVRTGIILLILVVIASAAGTFVLQRPITDAEALRRAYSPETLRWLDAVGLTDVFHSWWFVALMSLLAVNIICASIERFPSVWRFFSRPYLKPNASFFSGLPLHRQIPVRETLQGLEAAERALREMGLRPRRIEGEPPSLFAERFRFARLAAYIVHLSLLLILAGGIVDALWGYRGFLALTKGEQTDQLDLQNGEHKTLPFAIRCDGAGQENYPDGSPKRWWSKLVVLENGREVARKEIEVNDPLTHRGLRFFQSSYGPTGEVASVKLLARPASDPSRAREVEFRPGQPIPLDAETTATLSAFVPDLVIVGNRIESRSNEPNNPAIQLTLNSTRAGESRVWVFAKYPDAMHNPDAPYTFEFRDLEMGYYTGLQVAYEPGQWAVWAGCLLMALGLFIAFYFVHVRVWVLPSTDEQGRTTLWLGASTSKHREEFQQRFERLIQSVEEELRAGAAASPAPAATPIRA